MQCYECVVVTDPEVMARLAPLWSRSVNAYLATTGKHAPEGMRTFAVVPVGWPVGRFGPVRRRPVADVAQWDRW
jgi:hypothetical protein